MTVLKKSKFIHEGKYAAEVDVELVVNDHEWSPYLSLEDAYKLDEESQSLRASSGCGVVMPIKKRGVDNNPSMKNNKRALTP